MKNKRIYKYRAKRKDNGEWVYGSLVVYHKPNSNEIEEVLIVSQNARIFKDEFKGYDDAVVDIDTVGEFTDMLDCEDEFIYEGDILRNEELKLLEVVAFQDGGYVLKIFTELSKGNVEFTGVCGIAEYPLDKDRIVGNIWDNADLLGKYKGVNYEV